MELERERGITIKAQAVRVEYTARDGETYRLHLIDTPGHVDFTYEVSRSLAACDGALLVVDASQGVEAQTVANTYLAVDAGLELIPALNKIDLPGAEPERVAGEISELLGEPADGVIRMSAKTGEGVTEVLEAIVAKIPPPEGDADAPAARADLRLRVRPVPRRGRLRPRGRRRAAQGRRDHRDADRDRGRHRRDRLLRPADDAGGRAARRARSATSSPASRTCRCCASATRSRPSARPAAEPLPGYREVKPMVFCGLFPVETDRFADLRDALEKLALNDAALSWEPETSQALGFGFRCGFLGLLHMDIVRERLEREYDLELLATTPNVEYECTLTNGDEMIVHSPTDMPDPGVIEEIREPYIRATILCPKEAVGAVMELCQERRGTHVGHELPLRGARAAPLRPAARRDRARLLRPAEVAHEGLRVARLRADGHARRRTWSSSTSCSPATRSTRSRWSSTRTRPTRPAAALAERLRKQIPRQQFEVAIQAAIGSNIIARESVKAVRKDVIAKCYGGDITRKRKLLEKQKEGKKRMKQVGRIEVPQEAFLSVLTIGDDDD